MTETPETTFRVSYWLQVARYAGTCAACGTATDAGFAFVQKDRDGKYETVCTDCAEKHGRATPWTYVDRRNGADTLVTQTAASVVAGAPSATVLRCNRCRGLVAYVKSTKGKWYLANCYAKQGENPNHLYRVYNFDVHTSERCDQTVARHEADRQHLADLDAEARRRRATDAVIEDLGGVENLPVDLTIEQFNEMVADKTADLYPEAR